MIPSVIAHCPELGRDLSAMRAAVPDAIVYRAALFPPHSHDGCIAAHQAIVRMAQAARWPAVFVMEDDCAFTDHFSLTQWAADIAWAQAHDYTVLTGGCISARKPRLVRRGLFAVERFKSVHCVVYTEAAYDIVLRLTHPMDPQLGRLGARCLMAYPFVAVQAAGYSGIQDRVVDYVPLYQRYEATLEGLACGS